MDHRIDCNDGDRWFYVAYASVMVIIYPIGVPSLYGWLLWVHRTEMNPPLPRTQHQESGPRGRALVLIQRKRLYDEKIAHLEFLYGSYEARFYWFEVVELVRKLCQVRVNYFSGVLCQL